MLRLTSREGESLELWAFDGKLFTLICPRAYAPGAPLATTVELVPSCMLELKSVGSKLREDGSYDVRARAATLAKSTRERIIAALAGG